MLVVVRRIGIIVIDRSRRIVIGIDRSRIVVIVDEGRRGEDGIRGSCDRTSAGIDHSARAVDVAIGIVVGASDFLRLIAGKKTERVDDLTEIERMGASRNRRDDAEYEHDCHAPENLVFVDVFHGQRRQAPVNLIVYVTVTIIY